MRTLLLASILLSASAAFASEAVLEIAAGCDQDAFIEQVLEWESSRGLERSTEESLRAVFVALDQDENGVLDSTELAVVQVEPGY